MVVDASSETRVVNRREIIILGSDWWQCFVEEKG